MAVIQSDIRWILRLSSSPALTRSHSRTLKPMFSRASTAARIVCVASLSSSFRIRAFSSDAVKIGEKPSICSADELHYVALPSSDWKLALWRYHPNPQAPKRNHPLLLLSGVGTNAIGYDLSPESSFARHMSGQGFDTWILEVRGAGLSLYESSTKKIERSAHEKSDQIESLSSETVSTNETISSKPDAKALALATVFDESTLVTRLTETFVRLSERLSGFLSESQSKFMSAKFFDQVSKLLVDSQLSEQFDEIRDRFLRLLDSSQKSSSGFSGQVKDLSEGLVSVIEEGQRSVSPPLFDLQERFASTIEDFQKQLDLIVKYDWDFDHYLEEDLPCAMEYIRAVTKPKDGKLLAIGHSMGGILLYAMVSRCGSEKRDSGLASIVTLASSLDYASSNSTLKLLLPLADPAQALNVPIVPLGALLTAAYPLSSRPPYVLSWLNNLISAQDMMDPDLLKKLVLNNFCTIPAKLLIQLTTAFKEGGLRDRKGKFFYKDHLHQCNIPVLAIAGDLDLICPPQAVEETAKLIPEHLMTYKVFGEPGGSHYAHYDLVGGRLAVEQVYPCIIEFLARCDSEL